MIARMITAIESQLDLSQAQLRASTAVNGANGNGVNSGEESWVVSHNRALTFAQFARECLGDALVRCEEFYPSARSSSMLLVVVDREPAQWRSTLNALYAEVFNGEGSHSPVSAR